VTVSKKRADICYIFPFPVTGTKYKSRNLAYIFPVKIKIQLGIMSRSRDGSKRKPVQKKNSPLFFFLDGHVSQIATKNM
jgi:hypothetical protein